MADRKALWRRLSELRAVGGARVHEMNTLYDTPDGALARKASMLRIRIERPAGRAGNSAKPPQGNSPAGEVLLTFKGPVQARSRKSSGGRRYKIREEREVRVPDATALAGVLEALGLRPWFRYEKYRSAYRLPHLPGVTLDFDETPVGDFLELEGDCATIDRAAALLGYQPADYIVKSYGAIFLERARNSRMAAHSQNEPTPRSGLRDMLFRRRK